MDINKTTFYRSVAGMWHKTPEAAGGVVTCIRIGDSLFYPKKDKPKNFKSPEYGLITFDYRNFKSTKGYLEIQMGIDGRIWINVEGISVMRFKPLKKGTQNVTKKKI